MSNETLKTSIQSTPAPSAAQSSVDQIRQLIKDISDLKAQVAATPQAKVESKVQAPKEPQKIDWTKITEADIANLDITIPVYEQQAPEFLTVHLLDKNYIARWIHVLPERLGVCLATGYTYVEEKDLDKQYAHPLSFDANGHYSHGDVVCLKILKERYYGAIRRNYLKTMSIHGKAKVRSRAIQETEKEFPGFEEALHKGAISVYEPDDMKGISISPEVFSS